MQPDINVDFNELVLNIKIGRYKYTFIAFFIISCSVIGSANLY